MAHERWPDSSEGFRRLAVYERCMSLVEAVYQLTNGFPTAEQYALTSQMRRAATSIPMNIAEGYGRKHKGDYVRSLSIARGSAFELDAQLEIAVRLRLTDRTVALEALDLCMQVRRMLTTMITRMAS